MRSGPSRRLLAVVGALGLTLTACSSGSAEEAPVPTEGSPVPTSGSDGPAAGTGCAAAAGLSGPIEDRGTEDASAGEITLDASEFAFSPTCVRAGGGQTLEVTVTNGGSALHNLSVASLAIDEDVQAGESITVEVTLPEAGAVPFVCKYHIANGMQGAFLIG